MKNRNNQKVGIKNIFYLILLIVSIILEVAMKTINGMNRKIFFIFGAVLFIVFLMITYFAYALNTSKIYNNISVGQVDVSNLTKDQAVAKVKSQIANFANNNLTLQYSGKQWQIPYKDLGVNYNISQAVDRAYSVGRQGNIFNRLFDILKAKSGMKFDVVFGYNKDYLVNNLSNIKKAVDIEKKNAKIVPLGQKGAVVPEVKGVVVDLDKATALADAHITKLNQLPLDLPVKEDIPAVQASSLTGMTEELGSFSTAFNSADVSRVNNIKIACTRINGTILQPKQIFSVDSVIKERTPANGYKIAKAYFQSQVVDESGGGVCQVSTTLYDAALMANLDIVERSSHSMMVDYVEPGFDAAVSDKGVDLKFKNNNNFPIYLYSAIEANNVVMKVFGKTKDKSQTVKFEPQVTEIYYPEPEQVVFDGSISKGTKKVEVKSRNGYRASLYKNIYQNGVLISRQLVSDDLYKPRRGKIIIGI